MPTPRKYESDAEKHRAYRERQKQARSEEQAAKGLPPLPKIATLPGTPRWRALVEAARVQLEMARDEMEEYSADRSDAWQESDKAENHRARLESIETALIALEEIEF